MRYLILKTQAGEGCDYTIGCGMVYEFMEFDGPLQDAVKHFSHLIAYPDPDDEEVDSFALDGDFDLCEAWIVPADAAVAVDLKALRAAHKDKQDKATKRDNDARDKAEFERLKAKLGK